MATEPQYTTTTSTPKVTTLPTEGSQTYETQPIATPPPAPTNAVEATEILPSPASQDQVPGYLETIQNSLYGEGNTSPQYATPFLEGSAESELANQLSPGSRPGLPNLTSLYEQIRIEKGLPDLERSLTDLEAQKQEVEARLRNRTQQQRDKSGVTLGVIEGRTGTIERQERENIDFINRQIQTKSMQIGIANDIISTIMNLTSQDYTNAVNDYNARFSENLQVYEMVEDKRRFEERMKFEREQFDENKRQFEMEFQEKQKRADENMARANLQIYMDMITKGSLTWNNLTDAQRSKIGTLEVMAGLPVGFVSSMKVPPDAQIKHISTRVDSSGVQWTDILMLNQDGSFSVKSERVGSTYQARSGGSSGGSGSTSTAKAPKYNTMQFQAGLTATQKVISQYGIKDKKITQAQFRGLVQFTKLGAAQKKDPISDDQAIAILTSVFNKLNLRVV
jgi:hypothetical protein